MLLIIVYSKMLVNLLTETHAIYKCVYTIGKNEQLIKRISSHKLLSIHVLQ